MKKLKNTLDKLKKKKYNKRIHKNLLSYDAYAYPNLNLDGKRTFFNDNQIDDVNHIKIKFLFTSLIEKYIVFSDNMNTVNYLSSNELKYMHDDLISGTFSDKTEFLSRLIFSISHEQVIFQDRNLEQYIYRMITIFKDCTISNNYVLEKVGISLEKIVFLYWCMFAFILNDKKVNLIFSINKFKHFILDGTIENSITEDDLDLFLKFLLTDIKTFKDTYHFFRKDNGNYLSNELLNEVDKFLPKVSFYFPLLKIDDENFFLTSYTSLIQSLHMERLFYFIAEQKTPNYKSDIFGPLLEKYISNLANDYKVFHDIDIKIHYYEDQKYRVSKTEYFDYPDVIIESDDFVLFIESKFSAFNLKDAIIRFNEESFQNTIEGIEKSKNNISRFIEYNPLGITIDGKKIHKLICFNVVNSSMLGALKYASFINSEDLLLVDFLSLEALFNIKNEISLSDVLEGFNKELEDLEGTNTLHHYCIDNYEINYNKFSNSHTKLFEDFFEEDVINKYKID